MAQVQGLRHLTTAALSPVHAQGEGRPQCSMKPRQEGAKFAFWAFCSRKWDYKEQNAIDATKPNRQGVHPTATISHDFSGRNSLKFLQKENFTHCSKAKGLFLLFIG